MRPPGEFRQNDERRPWQDGGSSNETPAKVNTERTPRRPRTPVWHAIADVRVVVGRGERHRLLLLVARCPGCGMPHLHQARVPFVATIRTGACGVRYMLHAVAGEVAA